MKWPYVQKTSSYLSHAGTDAGSLLPSSCGVIQKLQKQPEYCGCSVTTIQHSHKGGATFWFRITIIPQLCALLSYREVKQMCYVLLNLARLYPQVWQVFFIPPMVLVSQLLIFNLRTTCLTTKRMVPRLNQRTLNHLLPAPREMMIAGRCVRHNQLSGLDRRFSATCVTEWTAVHGWPCGYYFTSSTWERIGAKLADFIPSLDSEPFDTCRPDT